MMSRRVALIAVPILAALAMSGCQILGKVSGGGWIGGVSGGKANMGFNGAQCETDLIEGHFNYVDKNAGVKMNGAVTEAHECADTEDLDDPLCVGACGGSEVIELFLDAGCRVYEVEFDYVSTNPRKKGSGEGSACATDCGEGKNTVVPGDSVRIAAYTGPFDGYFNFGLLNGGNIQAKTCTCTDGADNDHDGETDAADADCVDANDDERIFQ